MKNHLFLVATVISLLGGNNPVIQANTMTSIETLILDEYSVYAPDVPALPQEEDFLCGDVNEDGIVNVLDIMTLVNYVMEGNPDPFSEEAADVNADGFINVLDIISLVNIIMQVPGIPCGCVAPVGYEGQTYATVQIGEQCWLRENLNIGTRINSTQGGYQQMDNDIIEKYCYNNDEANCGVYGGLYEWPEAMQYMTSEGAQGICPVGWHIPTDNEWKILEGAVDSQYPVGDPEWDIVGWRGLNAGGNLKETGIIHWNPPNTGATNQSGFTNRAGGCRSHSNGHLYDLGSTSSDWTSSQSNSGYAWGRKMFFQGTEIGRYSYNQDDGFSVRCLKGCWPEPTQSNAGPDQLNLPGTSTTLAGNTPANGSGLWTIVGGTGGTIVTPSNPTSEFQGVAGNAYTLSWTITTQCGNSADTVAISFAAGFTCGDDLVYEGQSYATVLIGTHCWMAENLNVGVRINSTQGGFQQTDNGIIEKYCYNNDEANCDVYGGLYEWPEAMQYVTTEGAPGICPLGWHIAINSEWTALLNFLGGSSISGGKMKSIGTIEEGTGLWRSPNTGATNESGFTGQPGGLRVYSNENFTYLGYSVYFWSSSQFDTNYAWDWYLYYSNAGTSQWNDHKAFGFSVRCLMDPQ